MSETGSSTMSPALSLSLKAVANVVLIGVLQRALPQYISVFGGIPAYVIIGSLLTLMNLFLRPLLAIITFPFHLLFTLATTIAVNTFFLFVVYEISLKMDPNVVALVITGGLMGWLVVSAILGLSNWLMRHI